MSKTVSIGKPAVRGQRTSVVVCYANKKQQSASVKDVVLAASMAACLAAVPMVQPPSAEAMTYQERLEMKRQMMADLRQGAESQEAPAEAAPAETPSYLDSMKKSLSIQVPDVQFSIPDPAPEPEPTPPAPAPPAPAPAKTFSFSVPAAPAPEAPKVATSSEPAAKPWWERLDAVEETQPKVQPPAPKAPEPKVEIKKEEPRKVEVKKEEPKKVEAKEEPKKDDKQAGKRKGPLPLFLVQVLMFGIYGGGVYALLFKSQELEKIVSGVEGGIKKATASFTKSS